MNQITYDILFKGDVKDNISKEKAIKNFAKMFNSDIQTSSLLFNENTYFIKRNLPEESFLHFKSLFEKNNLSLWYRINKNQDSLFINNNGDKLCLECYFQIHTSNFCNNCINKNETNKTNHIKDEDFTLDTEDDPKYSSYFFKLGISYFIALFCLEGLLLKIWVIDLGFYPYIIGNIFFIIASIPYVEAKGYHKILSFLSMLNIFGIGLLILLPNRNDTQQVNIFNKNNFAALMMIMVSFYLFHGISESNDMLEEFDRKNLELSSFNFSYPKPAKELTKEDIDKQLEELNDLISFSFNIIDENDLNPEKTYYVTNSLFKNINYFLLTLKYKRFDLIINETEVPKYLTKKEINLVKIELVETIVTEIKDNDLSDNKRIKRSLVEWFTTYHKFNDWMNSVEPDSNRTIQGRLEDYFFSIYTNYRFGIELDEFIAKKPDFIDYVKFENNILFIKLKKLKDSNLSSKELMIGFYKQKYHNFVFIGGSYSIINFEGFLTYYNDEEIFKLFISLLH